MIAGGAEIRGDYHELVRFARENDLRQFSGNFIAYLVDAREAGGHKLALDPLFALWGVSADAIATRVASFIPGIPSLRDIEFCAEFNSPLMADIIARALSSPDAFIRRAAEKALAKDYFSAHLTEETVAQLIAALELEIPGEAIPLSAGSASPAYARLNELAGNSETMDLLRIQLETRFAAAQSGAKPLGGAARKLLEGFHARVKLPELPVADTTGNALLHLFVVAAGTFPLLELFVKSFVPPYKTGLTADERFAGIFSRTCWEQKH